MNQKLKDIFSITNLCKEDIYNNDSVKTIQFDINPELPIDTNSQNKKI